MKTVNLNIDKKLQAKIIKAYRITEANDKNITFVRDAKEWIEAIKTGRMLCVIKSVSRSGMSRKMKFHSLQSYNKKNSTKTGYYRQFLCFLEALGYTVNRKEWAINVGGCGMDMVFHVNYSVIHRLTRIGMLTKTECDELAQMTPTVL